MFLSVNFCVYISVYAGLYFTVYVCAYVCLIMLGQVYVFLRSLIVVWLFLLNLIHSFIHLFIHSFIHSSKGMATRWRVLPQWGQSVMVAGIRHCRGSRRGLFPRRVSERIRCAIACARVRNCWALPYFSLRTRKHAYVNCKHCVGPTNRVWRRTFGSTFGFSMWLTFLYI